MKNLLLIVICFFLFSLNYIFATAKKNIKIGSIGYSYGVMNEPVLMSAYATQVKQAGFKIDNDMIMPVHSLNFKLILNEGQNSLINSFTFSDTYHFFLKGMLCASEQTKYGKTDESGFYEKLSGFGFDLGLSLGYKDFIFFENSIGLNYLYYEMQIADLCSGCGGIINDFFLDNRLHSDAILEAKGVISINSCLKFKVYKYLSDRGPVDFFLGIEFKRYFDILSRYPESPNTGSTPFMGRDLKFFSVLGISVSVQY